MRYVLPVVKRRDTGELVSARAPANVLERTTADVSLLAGMLVDKFRHHLPLHRQHRRMADAGIVVSRSSLTNWAGCAAVASWFARAHGGRSEGRAPEKEMSPGRRLLLRAAGGIGAKKVDVTWATEEGGLLLGISIKGINFRDRRSKNFQKNLTNRRGDMLFEAVTLHRRFPYAVLGGLFSSTRRRILTKPSGADRQRRDQHRRWRTHRCTRRQRATPRRLIPLGRSAIASRYRLFMVNLAQALDPRRTATPRQPRL